jgi:predicted SprT family Zn-dependent metalloprotease
MGPVSDREILRAAHAIRNEIVAQFPEYAARLNATTFRVWSMRRCAGNTHWDKNLIKLSRYYFSIPSHFENELRNTVLHEIAHVLAPKGAGHNRFWRAIAIKLGDDGKRCHPMKLDLPERTRWTATCCQKDYITFTASIAREGRVCLECGDTLQYETDHA